MSEIHLTMHNGSRGFTEINRIVKAVEALGYTAEIVDNGTIIFNRGE